MNSDLRWPFLIGAFSAAALIAAIATLVLLGHTMSAAAAAPIDLRDGAGRLHRPLPLSPENPYSFVAGRIAPHSQVPPLCGTPRPTNLAAGGQLLLYRVPRWQLNNGSFALVVHNPQHPRAIGYVQF